MAYRKKSWLDRITEHPFRRRLRDVASGEEQLVELERDEGEVHTEGDVLNAAALNDLEGRIAAGFAGLDGDLQDQGGALDALQEYAAEIAAAAAEHAADKGNPHRVAPGQIGAATVEALAAHMADKGNPHGATIEQIGAVSPAQLAAHVNDHSNPHGMTLDALGGASSAQLALHVADKGNPHGVTAAQAGAYSTQQADTKFLHNSGTTATPVLAGTARSAETADKAAEASKTTGTLTITQGGTTKGTFNGSSNQTIVLDAGGGSASAPFEAHWTTEAQIAAGITSMAKNNSTMSFSSDGESTYFLTEGATNNTGFGVIKRVNGSTVDYLFCPASTSVSLDQGAYKGRFSYTGNTVTRVYCKRIDASGSLYFSQKTELNKQLLAQGSNSSGTFQCASEVTSILTGGLYTNLGRGAWYKTSNTACYLLFNLGAELSTRPMGVATYNPNAGSLISYNDTDGRYVMLTGNQTIAGSKTFSSPVTVATPTTDTHAATKKYVDDTAAKKLDAATYQSDKAGFATTADMAQNLTAANNYTDKALQAGPAIREIHVLKSITRWTDVKLRAVKMGRWVCVTFEGCDGANSSGLLTSAFAELIPECGTAVGVSMTAELGSVGGWFLSVTSLGQIRIGNANTPTGPGSYIYGTLTYLAAT